MVKVKIKVKRVNGGLDGSPAWITTFVDMTSLLVTFFILLFTFSSIQDYDAFTYPKNLIGTSGIISKKVGDTIDAPDNDIMSAIDLQRGARNPHSRPPDQIPESIEEMGQKLTEEHIEFEALDVHDGLRIRFDPLASFAPGSAEVNSTLRTALREFGETLQGYDHMFAIEGFTDNAFRPNSRFADAESLALARARAAADVILESSDIPAETLMIAGMGDDPLPGSTNATALERLANRRIELVILSMSKSRLAALEAREQ